MLRILLTLAILCSVAHAADPIRVFIRSGPKSHGPGAHDYPRFLKEWVPLLNERGARADGGDSFPTKEQLDKTDVLILHAQEAGNIALGEERKNLMEFLKRGGGLVVIHAGIVSRDPDWFKTIAGGSWNHKTPTKWLEAPMALYFTDRDNPITKDISNFDIDDEIYYDMDILPEVKVLAAAYTPKAADTRGKGNKEAQQRAAEAVAKRKAVNIYDIQPQMWTYERTVDGGSTPYRSFVCIPGHLYANFSNNGLRTAILRGIAWAGKRDNADVLCKPTELGSALRYLPGGCPPPQDIPKDLEVHPEFNLSLVASEPLINKPMNIDWDEKGRLWVVETPEYPNGLRQANVEAWKDSGAVKPGQHEREPLDRVSILSDTDGDGIMDKKQVFADKIELATSSVFYKNGVIVCAAPDILFFEDTDGDDKADKRTKLYTNLGNKDTHAVINNMRWGQDGWVYATHGYSSTEDAKSGDGSRGFGAIGAGVVRFKPDGSAIEQYASRGGNTWGLDITWSGEVFYTQPTSGNHFIHVVLPEYVLAKGKLPGVSGTNGLLPREPTFPAMHWEQQAYVQIDQVGSYTAAAGCAIYEGGAWPEKWNYGYFTTEPTLNIVSHFMVEPDGVTYKAKREAGREHTEFIRSKNLWFRPIDVRIGPDGALYVVDFCNQAVIHNDTRGPVHGPANAAVRPDRDHYYGRIWKVQHKDAKKVEVAKLKKDDFQQLAGVVKNSENVPQKQVAWRLIAEQQGPQGKGVVGLAESGITPRMGSKALRVYESIEKGVLTAPESLNAFLDAKDDWTRSAVIAAAKDNAANEIAAAFASKRASELGSFVENLIPAALAGDAVKNTTNLLNSCASAGPGTEALQSSVLRVLAQQADLSLTAHPALKEPLQKLLANPSTAAAALPLAAKWDKERALAKERKDVVQALMSKMKDAKAPTQERLAAARGFLGADGDGEAKDLIAEAAMEIDRKDGGSKGPFVNPMDLRLGIIKLITERTGPYVASRLMDAYVDVEPGVQLAIFDELLKRPEWVNVILDEVERGVVKPADIGPSNVARLRTHPNKQVASRANKMLEKLSPATVEKNKVIAQLTPEVEKTGDVAKGKIAYALCATCHKLGDTGLAVGPPLDGMGAHGPAELLVHIVDPNREVDPSFWAHNITTKKGEAIVGVITSENPSTLTLATQVGVKEIPKSEIATRENTRRSLMPEGLEAMGAETMRDLLAYICGDAQKHFRIVDLRPAYTADSREGVFAGPSPNQGQVRLAKYGNVKVEGIPFFVQDAAKSESGSNIIVLKGGPQKSQSWTYPQRVEVAVNAQAKKLHLLSGIAGWGFPAVRDHIPALKATVTYEGGETEEFTLNNGEAFADYIREVEVPGSQLVKEPISDDQQIRLLSLTLTKKGVIKKLALESFANGVAPVVIAVTADVEGRMGAKPGAATAAAPASGDSSAPGPKEGGKGDNKLPAVTPVSWEAGKTKVLLIGGGSSHNFARFFGEVDGATLKAAGFTVHYTEDRDQAVAELPNADVAVISVNRQFFDSPAYRKALFDRVAAGKGVIMMHPGTWYAYPRWPELNAQVVGGGSKGHDKLGPYSVNVTKADHPIMKGVPAKFDVTDELYYVNAKPEEIPAGTAGIEVLAETSPSQKFGKPHPSVWVTKNDKTRIACIALGHDERTHEDAAFKSILVNAVQWCSGK
ncbi:putative membrane-bound dehydrogenase-like protein [Roseimicrobium gellanilyticum]|uniref:Putative membrane-bound dehydrogenase-like protein n=1 Tax=Roseimicrobium gellanilyticum TaxID=748857 RepID=A0A366HWA8_9BACT|nr:PVC-type heme-binding CxxCH protein [Roseimicrobium gellanilyticum]RBP47989.1 putative membrane-bound dehydrogenase-like protein [Roseimicrobium gellanilyticum]